MRKLAIFEGFLISSLRRGLFIGLFYYFLPLIPTHAHGQTPLPRVVIETTLGSLLVEIDSVAAPVTASNFLRYVEAGAYNGGVFHRTVTPGNQPSSKIRIGVIQGRKKHSFQDYPPVPLERTSTTGLRHLHGVLSMARDAADTATNEFFICIGDQPELDYGGRRNPDGQGFAAFGRVLSGWLTVALIHMAPAQEQTLSPAISILGIRRLQQ